jgi:hypothetical protein
MLAYAAALAVSAAAMVVWAGHAPVMVCSVVVGLCGATGTVNWLVARRYGPEIAAAMAAELAAGDR